MGLAELLARCENLSELSDEELAELEADLEAAGEERADAASDEQLAELTQIATAVEAVRGEAQQRATTADERRAEAAAALERIRGEQAGDDDGEDADGEDAEADDGNDAEADDGATEEVEETDAEAETPEQIAAGGSPAPRAPRIGRVSARRPASMRPRPQPAPDLSRMNLVASANLANFTPGERLDDAEKLATAFWSAVESTKGYRHGPRVKVAVARAGSENPEQVGYTSDRILDSNQRENARKIAALTSRQSLAAAGGVCAPTPVNYDLPILGSTEARPVRDDMLVRFGADRGGVTLLPPPILTDLDGAVDIWTEANDQNPTSPTTKPCLEVTCPNEDETLVDAITKCLQFGNFRARFFGEQIEAWMRLAAANHARVAETTALTTIGTGSTQVTTGQLLGTIPDVLAALDRASAAIRSRHRLDPAFPLRFGAPFWLRDMMRTDEARRIPGGGTTDERYALADARIAAWFSARNINVSWFLDGETGQIFGAQGDGPLLGWPSTVVTYLYPEGSWLFLDGGTLDLGIVRDSTLNSTNDVQVFSETFENVAFHGVESYRLAMDVCPDGTVSGTSDIDPCSTGS